MPQLTIVKSEPLTIVPPTPEEAQTQKFDELYSMSVGSMKGKRQADAVITLMQPEERTAFYQWANQTHGAKKGVDAQSQRADSAIVGGVPIIGTVAPEDVLLAGAAVRGVKAAVTAPSVGGKVVQGAKALGSMATPAITYEATKSALEGMGASPAFAAVVAGGVSAMIARRGMARAGTAAAEEAAVARPTAAPAPPAAESPIELTRRLKAENQARMAATLPAGTVAGETAPPVDRPPSPLPAAPAKSQQQILNEEAIARRRAEYQARVAAAAEAPAATPAPTKPPMVPAAVTKEYLALRAQGMTHQQAVEAIEAGLAFQQKYGTPMPTAQDARFPKGQRGKPSGAAGMNVKREPE